MVIKRSLFEAIEKHFSKPEISLITGPRQAGKTFLMRQLDKKLNALGKRTLFLNMDIEEDKLHFESQRALIQRIKLQFGDRKGYVFLDEIQRKPDAGLFLKGLYDLALPYKFIVSGSGSLELKEKIHESLAGRKKVFHLATLSFFEFVDFKTRYAYSERLQQYFQTMKEETRGLLGEYIRFGGYPKVVLSSTLEEKQDAIRDIFQSYLERDISMLLRLEKSEALVSLVRLLASSLGSRTNISSLANTIGISAQTVRQYLWYLEKTFIIDRISPFTRRTGREIAKSPVVYFHDLGLYHYINGTFSRHNSLDQYGFVFQNLVYLLLKDVLSATAASIHYYRTKDGAEVDFIIESGKKIVPVEVKYSWNKKLPRALVAFSKKYKSNAGLVVTRDDFYRLPFMLLLA